MVTLLKLLAGFVVSLPGTVTGIQKILEILTKYFPPKGEGERAIDKYKDQVIALKEAKLKANEAIKEAKLGRTKDIERIINNPK